MRGDAMTITRVLHITPTVRLLGARRSLLALVNELAGTRYEPIVAVPSTGAITDELDKRRLRWCLLPASPWRKGMAWLRIPSEVRAMRAFIRKENIGLIHCNEIYPNPHALVAASQGGLAAECASTFMMKRPLHPLRIPVVTHMRLSVTPKLVRNYLLEHATRIIAVSHGAAADFDGFTWKDRKVRVVHNGVDFGPFERAAARRAEIRRRLGYSPDDFVIGQIGLLMPRKRPMFLINAMPEILNLSPNVRVLFVGAASPGQDSYVTQLQKRAEELKVADRIQWIPFQDSVAEFFAALDLNVLLSNDEGFGRVIIEAGAVGVPTIGSDVGGIPEVIEDGVTGYVLGPRNCPDAQFDTLTTGFAHLVYGLASDPSLRMAMGNAAHDRAHTLFSTPHYAAGVTHVFDEAMEEHRRNQPPW